MLIEPRDFSYLFGTLRGISDRSLSAHLQLYRQAVDRLNAIEQAYPLVEWKAAGAPDVGDAITAALLAAPVAKLDLRPAGPLFECLVQVENDLAARGIAFRPAWYLGAADDDFWTVDRAISVNIPWCFANPSLWRLANRSRFTAYTPDQMLRTLRHEAGHALLYGFELWRRPDWQAVFGDSRAPYRDGYEPVEGSRDFVEYTTGVRAHYGQKHPDEDFSETFACWLDPATNWRQQYSDWPGALRKLEYVDALARGRQFAGTPLNAYLGKRAPYQQVQGTVAEVLGVGTAAPSTGLHGTWSEHAALLEAEPAAYNDVLLHEAHFGALVGGGQPAPDALVAAVCANWGSWQSYLLDLRLCCAASRAWALTVYDERRNMVRNALVQPGGTVPVGCRVLLALDCQEHAYALDYGAAKHLGIAAQFENIDCVAVAGRLEMPVFLAGGVTVTQDFEADPDAVELSAAVDTGGADHRNAGREGLIPVEREVHRGPKTHRQIFWVRSGQEKPGDRKLEGEEAQKAHAEAAAKEAAMHEKKKTEGLDLAHDAPKFETDLYKLDWHGTPEEAIARNQEALVKVANEFGRHLNKEFDNRGSSGEPQKVAVVAVSETLGANTAACYHKGEAGKGGVIFMGSDAARWLVKEMQDRQPREGLKIYLHEASHAATPWISNYYERTGEAQRPLANLQESITELTAQHHVNDYRSQMHGTSVERRQLFTIPNDVHGIILTNQTISYPDHVERFARVATAALGLHNRQAEHGIGAVKAQEAIVGLAVKLKGMQSTDRYRHLGKLLCATKGIKDTGDNDRYTVARQEMSRAVEHYMDGSQGQSWTELLRAVGAAGKKASES